MIISFKSQNLLLVVKQIKYIHDNSLFYDPLFIDQRYAVQFNTSWFSNEHMVLDAGWLRLNHPVNDQIVEDLTHDRIY